MKRLMISVLVAGFGFGSQAHGQGGIITTVAGDGVGGFSGDGGPATSALLSSPMDVAVDGAGNLYIVEETNSRVRKVTPGGVITTFAGGGASGCNGGPASSSSLFLPSGIAIDSAGNVYIVDRGENQVCKVSSSGVITLLAGNGTSGFSGDGGPATAASLNGPIRVAADAAGNVYIADEYNYRVRMVSPAGLISTVAGNGTSADSGDGGPATSAGLSDVWGLAVDGSGKLFIAEGNGRRVRRVAASGIITTIAGNGNFELGPNGDGGPASAAEVSLPFGLALDAAGNLYISDAGENSVRKISTSGIITTIAGSGTPGSSGDGGLAILATLNDPHGVAVDASGNIFIAEYVGDRIREVSALPGADVIENLVLTGTATCDDSFCKSFGTGPITGTYSLDVTAQAIVGPWSFTTPFGVISSTQPGAGAYVAFSPTLVEPVFQILTSTVLEFVKFDFPIANLQQLGSIMVDVGSDACISIAGQGQACDPDYAISGTTAIAVPPPLTVSPASLSFTLLAGTASSQHLNLTGAPGVAWSATSSSSWITLLPAAGTAPGAITVDVDASSLQPGNYAATITIANPMASPAQETVNVSLTVTSTAGSLSVSPSTLSFQAGQGAAAQSQAVEIGGSTGTAWQATATTSNGGAWLSVSSAAGLIPASLTAVVNSTILAAGTYQGSITVQAPGAVPSSSTINVSLTVTATQPSGIITTVAGSTVPGSIYFDGDGGPATSATLNGPVGVALDPSGNLYISDLGAQRIAKVLSSGIITTFAGIWDYGAPGGYNGDGISATSAEIYYPRGILVDAAGDVVFADSMNKRIRQVSPSGIISTIAGNGAGAPDQLQLFFSGDGGPATAAELSFPYGIAEDAAGNLFIADSNNQRIRKVSTSGIITTVAGTATTCIDVAIPVFCSGFSGDGGPATAASFNSPSGVAVDASGDLFIADSGNNRVRKVSPAGIITTFAGNGSQSFSGDGGPATSAALNTPGNMAVDALGNLYIVDGGNHRIRMVTPGGVITTVAGNGISSLSGDGGPATAAGMGPCDVKVDGSGDLYIADCGNDRIRVVSAPSASPAIAPNGVAPFASTVNTIQPGEWVSIYGMNLASSTATWNGTFPTSLGGTSVTIDGKPAYLSLVSPGQINLQAPDDSVTGPVPVVVTTAYGSATSTVTLAQFAPAFLLADSTHVSGMILRPDGSGAYGGGAFDILGPTGDSLGYPTVAARAGDSIELYAVGLGPTSPPVPAGQPFSGAAAATNPVNVLINGTSVTPAFAGLSSAGVFEIDLTVPAGLGTGDVPITATVGGAQTPLNAAISLQ